jgi:hypothetical protein
MDWVGMLFFINLYVDPELHSYSLCMSRFVNTVTCDNLKNNLNLYITAVTLLASYDSDGDDWII